METCWSFQENFFAFKHFILVKSNNLFAQLSISHAVQVASKLIQKAKSTSKELRGSPRERGERLEGFSRRKNYDVLHVHAEKKISRSVIYAKYNNENKPHVCFFKDCHVPDIHWRKSSGQIRDKITRLESQH